MTDAVAPTIPSTTAPLLDPMAMLGGAQPHIAPQSPVDLLAALQDFRTGFFVLDMLLCLLVPILIQQFLTLMQNGGDGSLTLFAPILAWLWPKDDDDAVERTIEITQRFNRDGHKVWDYEQKNHLLQKAISLYLSDVLNLENKDAKYELLEKPRSKDEAKRNDSASENEDDGSVTSASSAYDSDDEDEDGYDYTGIAKLSVEALPMINTWIEVEKGILFKHEVITPENPGERKGVTETKVVFRFSSKLPDGSDRIDAFIDKAYTNYQEGERRKVKEDNSRYFYIQSGSKASSSDANKQVVAYKRYALGEEKTFENLFFDEKAQVMQLLDNFANKTGKFGIKGFPYKLGFLLHGPPGTGKTSLIKAIAQFTKRHLVTINLGKIKSNQELMDAIFDLKFAVQGLDSPVEYSFEDVIFVMEDIDCASSIVNKRDGDEEEEKDEAAATETDKKEGGQDEETKESEDVAEKEKVDETKKTKRASKDDFKSDDEKLMSMMLKLVMEDDKKHAKLNLAGLLNVLDGVIDCPGRIIIMTSNHPEKLDPALIRPGRINKKLLLSYMNATQVQQMIEYYTMTSLTEAHAARLEAVFAQSPNRVSPAQVEEMCAEFDSIDAILDAMERLVSV